MTPEEFIHTQRGGRLYFLWQREKVPRKREEYQRMFNEELKKINESIGEGEAERVSNQGSNKGDLISRNALLKAMEEERQYLLARGQTGAEHILVHHCLPIIDNASTVDAIVNTLEVRSQGKWLDIYATHIAYECSNCHVQMPITDYFNFCPNCGAKMQMGGTK